MLLCDTLATTWAAPPGPSLPPGRVAVYRAAVPAGPVPGQHLLPAGEQARAARFHHAADARRYLAARVLRRTVLAACAGGLEPAALVFAASPAHKPYLPAAPRLRFSVAHAGAWVLLAVAEAEVGIDLEPQASQAKLQELLATSFLPTEAALLHQYPQRLPEAWTRKEALAKALGWGIDERFAALPGLPGRYAGPGTWQVSGFGAAPDYVGALARPAGYGVEFFSYEL